MLIGYKSMFVSLLHNYRWITEWVVIDLLHHTGPATSKSAVVFLLYLSNRFNPMYRKKHCSAHSFLCQQNIPCGT